jgi:hypothetical protein
MYNLAAQQAGLAAPIFNAGQQAEPGATAL